MSKSRCPTPGKCHTGAAAACAHGTAPRDAGMAILARAARELKRLRFTKGDYPGAEWRDGVLYDLAQRDCWLHEVYDEECRTPESRPSGWRRGGAR